MKKTVIHVGQATIQANRRTGADDPPLIVRTYKGAVRAFTVELLGPDGTPFAKVVNRPHDPLACGARIWVETYGDVRAVTSRAGQGDLSDEPEAGDGDAPAGAADPAEVLIRTGMHPAQALAAAEALRSAGLLAPGLTALPWGRTDG